MAYNYEWPYVGTEVYNDDWLLKKMFELIEEWKNMRQEFATLQEAFNSLKAYVDNYFDNLDVQTEINNKLDAMVADGTLSTLLSPLVHNWKSPVWTGKSTAAYVGDAFLLSAPDGAPLYQILSGNLQVSKSIPILSGDASLFATGALSYYNMVKTWWDGLTSDERLSVDYLFIYISFSDLTHDSKAISTAIAQLEMPGSVYTKILLPPLLDNMAYDAQRSSGYRTYLSLGFFGGYKIVMNPLTMVGNLSFYSNGGLQSAGANIYVNNIVCKLLLDEFSYNFGYSHNVISPNSYIDITVMEYNLYTTVYRVSGQIGSDEIILDLEFPLWSNITSIIPIALSNISMAILSINRGSVRIARTAQSQENLIFSEIITLPSMIA